ncbi:hypothetical protein U4E84_14860 [Halorubrum sp. AD140]|uniref:hypothetical protein n=1 Tax=Halorubrum sp. AD140 TaxID=3050073 RepID=UPI002ACC3E86|nr:hypothetical protein [Halorubrum sp. AD140]MDZ5812627.1 hypothetical protein [Halorubrum sp. AD140]
MKSLAAGATTRTSDGAPRSVSSLPPGDQPGQDGAHRGGGSGPLRVGAALLRELSVPLVEESLVPLDDALQALFFPLELPFEPLDVAPGGDCSPRRTASLSRRAVPVARRAAPF